MILGVYSIRDSKTGFLQPTFENNDAVALRNFQHAIVSSESVLSTHAPDFCLCRIGSFDSESGAITPEAVSVVAQAAEVLLSFAAASDRLSARGD